MESLHQPQPQEERRNPVDRRQQLDRRSEARFQPGRTDRRQQPDRRRNGRDA